MINVDIREEIQRLRSCGMTYIDICEKLGQSIPKSTLSYICKDITLPEEYYIQQRDNLLIRLKDSRVKAFATNKKNLQFRLDGIRHKAEKVVQSETKMNYEKIHLAMLYKAEGSKYKSYRGLALGSSETVILQTYMKLLEGCYGKNHIDFRARVQWRADQNIEDLQNYWAQQLRLSHSVFYRSSPDKRTIGRPTTRLDYMGVCVISCSGADIQLELDMIAQLYSEKLWGVSSFG